MARGMARPGTLRLAQLLLLRLLLFLPRGALPGTGRDPAGNPPQQVSGVLGGSVSFPLRLPPTTTVEKIEWSFQGQSGFEFQIATYWDGKLERRNASDRFGQRVEMAEETTLRIRALEKEDSGVLRARVLLATSDIHEQVFGLSVFEPLPDPHIRALLASQTAGGCNVTLQCLASEGGGLNISWKRGDPLRVLEEGSGWYQLSAEGTDLHLSWGPGSPDSSVTCLLSSPVEQKNASLDLLSICPDKGHPRKTWFLLAVLLFLIPAAGVGSYLWKNRSSQEAVSPAAPEKNRSPELLYVKLQNRRSPPEGGERQDLDQLPPGQAEASRGTMPVTIYASLLPPPAT